MKKSPFSEQRERILADAICPVVSELRLIDAADLISLIRFERRGSLADLVASSAELYFHPGTIQFGVSGDYRLDWDQEPEVSLDLEIRPRGVTIYAKLTLGKNLAGIEINHIAFQNPSEDPEANTRFLINSLEDARFYTTSRTALAS